MPSKRFEDVPGTWLRGADGGLYFIPDQDLAAYRVPDDQAAATLAEIDAEADVAGFTRMGPVVQPLAAVRGPLAKKDLASGPAAIVPPAAQLRGLRQTRGQ